MAACAALHARAPSVAVGARRVTSRRRVASRAASRRVVLPRADAKATGRSSETPRPEGDLESWTLRARAAAFACVASAALASGAAAEPAAASGSAATKSVVAVERDVTSRRTNDDDDANASSFGNASFYSNVGNVATTTPDVAPVDGSSWRATTSRTWTTPELLTAAARDFVKPLLGEFGAAVIGFGAGATLAGLFFGWRASSKSQTNARAASRAALADLSALDESEIQDLIGELPAWLAFRDVERGGWTNKVLSAAWPYLDVATSDVICAALDPILAATRPSFLTALRFERFSFGSVPAKIEGVKVYETKDDGAVEIDLSVFWRGDPDVVLGVRAAQDALSVPVSLTEFQCAFTLRLIFAPLIGVFPCFGALTIALVDEPRLDFDLRVVGGDVTLVPGLKESLRTYIKALIASWMVWPRCITVAIPGTGYELPSDEGTETSPRAPTGLLHVQVLGHDGRGANPGEIGLLVRSSSETSDLFLKRAGAAETRVQASPGGGVLSSREVTLPVEDPGTQLLCVRWYSKTEATASTETHARTETDDAREATSRDVSDSRSAARRSTSSSERLTGEASVVLEELMRQAPEAREPTESDARKKRSSVDASNADLRDDEKEKATGQWGPVPVFAELEAPAGADITRVRGEEVSRGGVRGVARRAARGVGGFFGKTAGGVVAGYRAARSDGLRRAPIRDAAVDGWRARGEKARLKSARDEAKDREALVRLSTGAAPLTSIAGRTDGDGDGVPLSSLDAADPGAGAVRLRVRYQPLDAAALSARAAKEKAREQRKSEELENASFEATRRATRPTDATDATDALVSDALESARAALRDRDREAAEMRAEKAELERKLREATEKNALFFEREEPSGKRASAKTSPREKTTNDDDAATSSRPSRAFADDAAAAALVASPAADADPRLAPLVAAARSAAAAVAEARVRHVAAEASGGFGRGFGRGSEKRESLETAMARADALVARAAAAVAESARAAEADEELAELKRAIRSREKSEDDDANLRDDAASR